MMFLSKKYGEVNQKNILTITELFPAGFFIKSLALLGTEGCTTFFDSAIKKPLAMSNNLSSTLKRHTPAFRFIFKKNSETAAVRSGVEENIFQLTGINNRNFSSRTKIIRNETIMKKIDIHSHRKSVFINKDI